MSILDEYERTLLPRLDEEVEGRFFTRYDVEIAKMGFEDGFKKAMNGVIDWLAAFAAPGEEKRATIKACQDYLNSL